MNRDKCMNPSTNIFTELKERIIKPWTTSFTLYFILIIVIFGGMGVIATIIESISNNDWNGFPLTLMTYSLAILVPAGITIILRYFLQAKNKVSLVLVCIFGLVVTALCAYVKSIICASLFVILAWLFWVIANADNIELNDNAYNENIKKDLEGHGKDWN